jgi:hypothetical protein
VSETEQQTGRARDVLDYIAWGEYLLLRVEMQEDGTWPFTEDEPRDMLVSSPGEVEPRHETDRYFPEYAGLLDTQLYWPGAVPVRHDAPVGGV